MSSRKTGFIRPYAKAQAQMHACKSSTF